MKTNTQSQSASQLTTTDGVFYTTIYQVVYVACYSLLTNQSNVLAETAGVPHHPLGELNFNARSPALDLVPGATSLGPNQPEKRLLHRAVELMDGPTPSFHLMVIQVSHQ